MVFPKLFLIFARHITHLTIIINTKNIMKKILTCLLTLLGLTTACGQQNYENTDVKGFAELLGKPGVILLDVRTADEYAEGHLQGAILVDQRQDDFVDKAMQVITAAQQALDKDGSPTDTLRVAVYCRSGRRSASAANKLAAQGCRCVNLKGGIIAWKAAGMPVTTAQ